MLVNNVDYSLYLEKSTLVSNNYSGVSETEHFKFDSNCVRVFYSLFAYPLNQTFLFAGISSRATL